MQPKQQCNESLLQDLITYLWFFLYFADLGREAVDAANGIHTLLQLLRLNANVEGSESDRLRTIACGFLLNLTNTHGEFLFCFLDCLSFNNIVI